MDGVDNAETSDTSDSEEGYDAADNAYKCWELAIRIMREKLEAQAQEAKNG